MSTAAFYYPCLACPQEVCVGGCKVLASHDMMAACDEKRCFADKDFLVSIFGADKLDALTVKANPPCETLNGTRTKGGDKVFHIKLNNDKFKGLYNINNLRLVFDSIQSFISVL